MTDMVLSKPPRVTLLVVALTEAVLAVVTVRLAVAGNPLVLPSLLFLLVLGAPLISLLPVSFSRPHALTAAGIRLPADRWSRRQVVVAWDDIDAVWITATGRYDYLYVLPGDLTSYTGDISEWRAGNMAQLTRRHGMPLTVPLSRKLVNPDQVRRRSTSTAVGGSAC